ncbi:HVO_A0114 family putative DNA-binding protein [Natrinema sp. LN54]|uniref:HVO_A0114 family putative DNA-binding protein n=1 Tax=Natrinema sp. LN54 TaxID=3458705 RepID=UPI0040353B2C
MTQTLHVRVNSSSDRSDLEDTLAVLDADESVDQKPSMLSIEGLETFGRIFRPTNLELLEAIADHEPESIRELARTVDRHPPEVTDNVTELADYGLVDLEENGRAKRPVVWYDEIDVDIPIGQHSPDVAPA